MLHPYCPLTAEDSAIFETLPRVGQFSIFACWQIYKAYHRADQRDARIMLDLGRAIHENCGLTVRAWVMAQLPVSYEVVEYTLEDFEYVTLAEEDSAEFDKEFRLIQSMRAEECRHGYNLDMLEDHPQMCPDCWDDSHSDELPADSWAGGFAENH